MASFIRVRGFLLNRAHLLSVVRSETIYRHKPAIDIKYIGINMYNSAVEQYAIQKTYVVFDTAASRDACYEKLTPMCRATIEDLT